MKLLYAILIISSFSWGMMQQQQIGQPRKEQDEGICLQACYDCCCDWRFLTDASISILLFGTEYFRVTHDPSELIRLKRYYPFHGHSLMRRLRNNPQDIFLDATHVALDHALMTLEIVDLFKTGNYYYQKHKEKLKAD